MTNRHHNESTPVPAHGLVRDGAGAPLDVTWFFWTDPETGERLRVAMGASDAFRARLARAGFVEELDVARRAQSAGDPAAA